MQFIHPSAVEDKQFIEGHRGNTATVSKQQQDERESPRYCIYCCPSSTASPC
jgi:hypothetical protein